MWSYYGWKYLGVDKEDGSAIYYDKDENGTIDDKDKVYLGSAIPDFTYGITLNAAYKGFDLTVFGSGSYGGELMRRPQYACRQQTLRTLDGVVGRDGS